MEQEQDGYYNAPMNMYGGSIQVLTNPEDTLTNLQLTLKSQILSNEGKLIEIGKPLMNERGINSVMGVVKSVVSQVTIFSNLNEDEIRIIMVSSIETLIRDLMLNSKEYDMGKNSRNKVITICRNTILTCVKRALKGDDKRFWKGAVIEQTVRTENNDNKGGILSKLNPWK